ncbi:hypothetical protein GCM10010519_46560 [Streptomyces lactacystinicus]
MLTVVGETDWESDSEGDCAAAFPARGKPVTDTVATAAAVVNAIRVRRRTRRALGAPEGGPDSPESCGGRVVRTLMRVLPGRLGHRRPNTGAAGGTALTV